MPKPVLIIIAGANGCGKTSLKKTLLQHPWTEGCEFVNPDDFAKEMFGGWDNPDSFLKAQVYATELTEKLIAEGKNLLLETAFSSNRKLELVERAKKAGYFIRIYFIGTDSPTINASRVCRRMMEGGHEVYLRDIIKRHAGAEKTCIISSPLVDRLYVFDNSIDNKNPVELFRVRDGYLGKVKDPVLEHTWSTDMLKNIITILDKSQRISLKSH